MSRNRKPGPHRFGMEQLEDRVCLSINPVLDAGVLSIQGSAESDTVLVADNGRGVISVVDGNSLQRWQFEGVEQILVDAGDEADVVRFRRAGGNTPIPQLDVMAGGGDDDVFIGLLLPAVQSPLPPPTLVSVDLGDGHDFFRAQSTNVERLELDLTAGQGDDTILIGLLLPAVQKIRDAAVRIDADLGIGNDQAQIHSTGVDLLELDLAADEGDDEVLIGMLLPAVQKVRDSAARLNVDLGTGDDFFRANLVGIDLLELDLSADIGNDKVLIGMLLPAVQKVRESAARLNIDLGEGNDLFRTRLAGVDAVDAVIEAGIGDDDLLIGLLLPAQPGLRGSATSSAGIVARLGAGNDSAMVTTHAYDAIQVDVDTGPAEDGEDSVAAVYSHPLPRVPPVIRRIVSSLDGGSDTARVLTVGYESPSVTTEQTRQITLIQDL